MEKMREEIAALKDSAAMSRIVADFGERQDRSNKRLMVLCIIQSFIIVILICALMFIAVNGQQALDEAMWKALNAAGNVAVTTTEQTVEGDSATIYNVEGDQFTNQTRRAGADGWPKL